MARTSKVEACIFCEKLPCECNAPAKPKARPKKLQPKKTETVKADSDPFGELSKQPNRFKKQIKEDIEPTQDELELIQAMRNVAPLMHNEQKRRYPDVYFPALPVDVDKRLVEWKDKHAEG